MQNDSPLKENPFEEEKTSTSYKEVDKIYELSAIELLDSLRLDLKDKKVFDLGSGTGVSSQVLLEKGGATDLTLVEPSVAMNQVAKSRLGDKAKYLEAGAENFCFTMDASLKAQIDVVIALNCLHLVPDLPSAFINAYEALKPGGVFAFNLTAPTYGFVEVTEKEKQIFQANVNFYTSLNEKIPNPILEHTAKLLQAHVDGDSSNVYTKAKLFDFFDKAEFEFADYQEVVLGFEAEFQRNIWRMMAQSFTQDASLIEELVTSVSMPDKLLVRQAMFKLVKR